MGMLACYIEADKELLNSLKKKNSEDLLDEIEELEDEEDLDIFELDKMWDGLHCLLTGSSATTPMENNLLSEAIIGTNTFSEDEEDFIAYIYPDRLAKIVRALEQIKIDDLSNNYSSKDFDKKDIYPSIWLEEDEDEIREELLSCFQDLKEFYRAVIDKNKGIIISIY